MLRRILLVAILVLSVGCEQQPEDVVEDYFAEHEKRYKIWEIVRIDGEKEVDVGKYIRLSVWYGTQDRRAPNPFLYYVKRTPDGYRIDWEASLGNNPMSWQAYMAQRPLNPMMFRIKARLASWYHGEFHNAQPDYFSILIVSNLVPDLYGYVKRRSKSGKRMYEILKDGERHHLTVKMRFLPYRRNSPHVLIDTLISENWVID
ncbi:MAG: UxaA family hydrolase [Gammaproteobacteria bacterium]|nr:UxaA family hydrolase [Gammaproteobacteria bacterium]